MQQRVPMMDKPLQQRKQIPVRRLYALSFFQMRTEIPAIYPELEGTPGQGEITVTGLLVVGIIHECKLHGKHTSVPNQTFPSDRHGFSPSSSSCHPYGYAAPFANGALDGSVPPSNRRGIRARHPAIPPVHSTLYRHARHIAWCRPDRSRPTSPQQFREPPWDTASLVFPVATELSASGCSCTAYTPKPREAYAPESYTTSGRDGTTCPSPTGAPTPARSRPVPAAFPATPAVAARPP